MSRLTPEPLSLPDAALAILAAVVSNNVSKIAIGAVVGRGAFALETRGDGGSVPGRRGGGLLGRARSSSRLNPN